MLRCGHDGIRRRHSELHEAFDGDDGPDPRLLVLLLLFPAEFGGPRYGVIGPNRDDRPGLDEPLRVPPFHLQHDPRLLLLTPDFGGGLRRLPPLSVRLLLLFQRLLPLLDVLFPYLPGDRVLQPGADNPPLHDELNQLVRHLRPPEASGMLDEVDPGQDGEPKPLHGSGVGLRHQATLVGLLHDHPLSAGREGDERGVGRVGGPPVLDEVHPLVQVRVDGHPELFGRHVQQLFPGPLGEEVVHLLFEESEPCFARAGEGLRVRTSPADDVAGNIHPWTDLFATGDGVPDLDLGRQRAVAVPDRGDPVLQLKLRPLEGDVIEPVPVAGERRLAT